MGGGGDKDAYVVDDATVGAVHAVLDAIDNDRRRNDRRLLLDVRPLLPPLGALW